MRSRTIDLDGPLHVAEHGGDGPATFVLVHGLGGSTANWASLGPRLAAHGRTVAIDLPGFGRTPPAGRSPRVDALAEVVARFIERHTDAPAIVIGNSMGGLVSMLVAAGRPDLVDRLVLLNPAAPSHRALQSVDPVMLMLAGGALLTPLGLAALRTVDRRMSPERRVAESFANLTVRPERISPDVVAAHVVVNAERRTQPWAYPTFLRAYRSILARLVPPRYVAVTRAISRPTLLVHGTADRIVPYRAAQHLARLRPDWWFESLDDCGHVPMLEHPDVVATLVTRWLTGVGSAAA